jgi:hypothetical protein
VEYVFEANVTFDIIVFGSKKKTGGFEMIVTFFLKLRTFFINYFGKLDTLINT